MLKLAPLLALLLLLDHGHMDNFLWTVRDKNVDNMFSVEMMCTFLLLNCRNVDTLFDGHRHRNFSVGADVDDSVDVDDAESVFER